MRRRGYLTPRGAGPAGIVAPSPPRPQPQQEDGVEWLLDIIASVMGKKPAVTN